MSERRFHGFGPEPCARCLLAMPVPGGDLCSGCSAEVECTELSDGSVPVRQLKTENALYVQFAQPEDAPDATLGSQSAEPPPAGNED